MKDYVFILSGNIGEKRRSSLTQRFLDGSERKAAEFFVPLRVGVYLSCGFYICRKNW